MSHSTTLVIVKRIAIIRNSYSYDFGGGEKFPIDLAITLKNHGYEPYLLSANKKTLHTARNLQLQAISSPWWSYQNFSGVRLLLLPLYLFWIVGVCFWYIGFILRHNIDIVYPQSRDDFIAATLAAKLLRKRVIWTDHADLKYIFLNNEVWYKNPIGKLSYQVSKLADVITTASNSELRLIEKSLGHVAPTNFLVVYLGVKDSFAQNKVVKKEKTQGITLIATSRLVKDKGIGDLIEAMKIINNNSVTLRLYGDGPDATLFKKTAASLSNIEFAGHTDDIPMALSQADIFIHPTHREGFGLSIVEAEMASLPIVASNIDSIPEIVKDRENGILVTPNNPTSLAQGITELVNDAELRHSMGIASRKIYLEKFQFEKVVKENFLPLLEK